MKKVLINIILLFTFSISGMAQIEYGKTVEISKEVLLDKIKVNPEKPDVPLNKNDAFQKVQKRRVQEKR